ncbi:MAG: sensor histidine kinase, partial [Planctomycetota bacterium]
ASVACALREGSRLRGAIYVERTRAARPFRAADSAFLAGLADEVSLALANAEVLSRLRRERDEAGAALAGLNVGVILADLDFRVVLANAAAADLLGPKAGIPRGSAVFDLFRGLRASPGEDAIRAKWLPGGIRFRLVREAREPSSGPPRTLAGAILPHPRGTLEPHAAVVVLREASEAERVEELKTFFLERLAHKLRGPLTVIHGELPLLRDPAYRGEASGELLDELQRSSAALCRLLDQFAEYTELELQALEKPAEAETSPIDAIVREIADTAASAGAPKRIEVAVELAPELPSVPGTREQLIRAFRQVLDNAVRYCPEGGRIQVRVEASEGWVRVSVADDGPGIPPEEIEAVFRPYYQVAAGRAGETCGAGLGLPIARGIVERLGGTIEITSPWGFPDRGTLVVVRLPASAEEPEAPARRDAREGGGLESLWL